MTARPTNEDLRKWFDPKHPEGGWKRINSKGEVVGPCAREPGEPKPKCMSNEKRAQLSKKERAAAVSAKRRHDPNPEREGKPINVSNFGKGKISEENKPTNPELWARAKALARSKFDVYPSAYANGWAAKWYKEKGGKWKTMNEQHDEREYDYEGDMIKSDLRSVIANANRIIDMLADDANLPEWCQSKITLAEDYVSTVANYLTAESQDVDESVDIGEHVNYVTRKPIKQLGEGMISYMDFRDKIDAHRKAGHKIVDDKYDEKKAVYTAIDHQGMAKKVIHTPTGSKVENLGSVHGEDDEADTTVAKPEKRGRGRPVGSKSGARRHK